MSRGGARKGSGPAPRANSLASANVATSRITVRMSEATWRKALALRPLLEQTAHRDTGFRLTLSEAALWRGLVLRGLVLRVMDRHMVPTTVPSGHPEHHVRVILTPEQFAMLRKKGHASTLASVLLLLEVERLNPSPVSVPSPPTETLSIRLPTVVVHRGKELRRQIERGAETLTRFGYRLSAADYWSGQLARALEAAGQVTMHGPFPEVPGRVRRVYTKIACTPEDIATLDLFADRWALQRDETLRRLLWASMRPRS